MRNACLKLFVRGQMLWNALKEEHGQDLVEYAAVISIIILGVTAGMSTLASGINSAMAGVSTKISKALS